MWMDFRYNTNKCASGLSEDPDEWQNPLEKYYTPGNTSIFWCNYTIEHSSDLFIQPVILL